MKKSKLILFIIISFFSIAIFAYNNTEKAVNFTCRTAKNFNGPLGWKTSVEVIGSVECNDSDECYLSHQSHYKILDDINYVWAENSGKEFFIKNNPKYKPRKYHDHLQFRLHDYLNNTTSRSSWGTFNFIFPEFENYEALPMPFKSYLIMTGVDDHFGTTAPLYCWKEKSSIKDLNFNLSPTEEIQESYDILSKDFGLDKIQFTYNKSFLENQIEQCKAQEDCNVTFRKALKEALISIMNDNSDIESPLELAKNAYEEKYKFNMNYPLSYSNFMRSKWMLRDFLNNNKTSIAVGSNGIINYYPPENGESVENNWIFYLSIPELSDHLYWVIVDKTGKNKTYNYGFN